MTTYGKLVRDRIPEIIRADGREPDMRVLGQAEYVSSLFDKLVEEAEELRSARGEDRPEEAADVYEVLVTLTTHLGMTLDNLARLAERKRTERGGFERRIWLDSW